MFRLIQGLFLIGLVGGGAYVLSSRQPNVASGLAPVVASSSAARSFDRKADALRAAADQAKKTGKPQDIQLTFTEEELTSKVAEVEAQAVDPSIAAANTQVHLQGANIVATSTITVSGITLNVGIVATPAVVNGKTQIVVTQVQAGALPLPDAIKDQLNAQIGQAIDPAKLGIPIDVTRLQVVDGKLVLQGTARP